MHASVQQFFKDNINKELIKDKSIIEVGSLVVNGSVRPYVESLRPKSYVGVDFVDGEGVDKVMNAENLTETYGKNSFSVVISTEMLEHAEHWRKCVQNMKDICKEYLIITTRGPGFPFHGFPHDHWRYTTDDFRRIFADYKILTLEDDTEYPGVFMMAKKTKRKPVNLELIELTPAPNA